MERKIPAGNFRRVFVLPVFFLCAIMKRMSGLGERVGFSGEMAGAMGRRSWAVGSVPGSMELSTNN